MIGDIFLFKFEVRKHIFNSKNVFIDKPLTIILIGLIVLYLYEVYVKQNINTFTHVFYTIIAINVIFIFTLCFSLEYELESPVRYILSFLHLKLVSISTIIEN